MNNMKRILSVSVGVLPDEDPDTSYLDQDGFEDRLAQCRRGDFGYAGVRAEAEVQLGAGTAGQTIRSGGLWGIESDSEPSYFAEVEAEQLAELKDELRALGFSARAIAAAFRDVERKGF